MKKIDLGQTMQIVANLGVIAGLIFVGVQLQQDRRLGDLNNVFAAEAGTKYWAELVSSSPDVWVKGISCEPLTVSEEAVFGVLAAAWEMEQFTGWYRMTQLEGPRSPDSIAIEAADELVRNPGLLAWWRNYQARFAERERLIGAREEDPYVSAIEEKIELLTDESLPLCE